jgi:hypothetical protein
MKKALLLLLPFRRIFRRLELENCWWHRLSLVLFFAALLFAFLATAGLSYLTFAPQVSSMPDIWQTVNPGDVQSLKPGDPIPTNATIDESAASANLPPGFVLDDVSGSKTVQMPDGSTATFPGSMSDAAIKAHWTHAEHRQLLSALLFAGLIAIVSTLILSYALQVAYRALLYVIFGGKPLTESEPAAT